MKRKIVALLAATMVLGSTATFVAAPSAPASSVTVSDAVVTKVTAEGTKGEVQLSQDVSINESALVEAIKAKVGNKEAKVLATFDVNVKGATAEELKAGIKLTFEVPFQATKGVKVLHLVNGVWQEEKVNSYSYGKVTATFHSFSPVAIVEVEKEAGSSTTDKTGVGVSALSLAAAAGLAGAVVCGKKKSN